jgi:hypothetical protein
MTWNSKNNQEIPLSGINAHFQNGIAVQMISQLQESPGQ